MLFCVIFFASQASAGIFVYQPTDKAVIFDEVYMLKGTSKDLTILKVNEIPIKYGDDGAFTCGLVLKPGKNFVEVRALDKNRERFSKQIRLLRLKTYPDIERLYNSKRHWARNQVVYLSTLGFIEGYPDDNFYPGLPVTRGELATWIARIKRLPLAALTEDVFVDVPKEHWRAPYIKAAVEAGYVRGSDQDTFGVDDPVSRREAAEIVVLTEGVGVVEQIKSLFLDVPEGEEGSSPIYTARQKGLFKGVSQEIPIFDPDRALTRAETAVLLSRFTYVMDMVRLLFDFESGFTAKSMCRINLPPEILAFTFEPATIQIGQKTVVKLRLKLAPREGFTPISRAKVDLTPLGGLPDTEMFDDATHGDVDAGDGIYSLNLSLEPKETGEKSVKASVIDRLGWEAGQEAKLLILE